MHKKNLNWYKMYILAFDLVRRNQYFHIYIFFKDKNLFCCKNIKIYTRNLKGQHFKPGFRYNMIFWICVRLNDYLVVENQVLNVGFNDFIKTSSIFNEIMIQGPESFKVDGFKCLTAQFADIGECQLKSLDERVCCSSKSPART